MLHVEVAVEHMPGHLRYHVEARRLDGSLTSLATTTTAAEAVAAASCYLRALAGGDEWAVALTDISAGELRA